jgi:hypothetical protein
LWGVQIIKVVMYCWTARIFNQPEKVRQLKHFWRVRSYTIIWDYLQEEWRTCEFFSIVPLFTSLSGCALFLELVSWTVRRRISCTSVVITEISPFLHVSRKQLWNTLFCKWHVIFTSYQWRRSRPPPPNGHGARGPCGTEHKLCWGLNFGFNSDLLFFFFFLKRGSILDRSAFASNYSAPHD